MVEDHARVGVIDAIVHVVAEFLVAKRLPDDLAHGRARRGHQKPPRLREDLDLLGKQPIEFVVDRLGKSGELRHRGVVGRGKTAADIEQFEVEASRLRLGEDVGAEVDCLDVVLRVGALAADVEREPLDDEIVVVGILDQVNRLAGQGSKLTRELHHRAGVGHAEPQCEARMRRVLGDLLDLLMVVIGHQRLVAVELLERLNGLDRVGVDDLVPDEVLTLLRRELGDVLVDGAKLLNARHVEAAAEVVEGLHDRRVAVDLHCVVDLHAGKVLTEQRVVFPQFGVVDDEQGTAVLLDEFEERLLIHAWCLPSGNGWAETASRLTDTQCRRKCSLGRRQYIGRGPSRGLAPRQPALNPLRAGLQGDRRDTSRAPSACP